MAPVEQRDADGEWRKAIPLPFYTRRWFGFRWAFLCNECGVKFASERAYRDHYRSDHP